MSRLTDLIARAKAKDPAFGSELEREFEVLSARRSFGLNFVRHRPESVELPGRPTRKGDTVRVLPPRGTAAKGDQRLWKVLGFERENGTRLARLELLVVAEPENSTVAVEDLIVAADRELSTKDRRFLVDLFFEMKNEIRVLYGQEEIDRPTFMQARTARWKNA